MADILTADDIAKLETQEVDNPTPMARKAALSATDVDHVWNVEQAVKQGNTAEGDTPKPFSFETGLHKIMVDSQDFAKNIGESFKNGDESSALDIAAYDSMFRGTYDSDVKPLRIEYQTKLKENPVDGKNFLSDAVYSVAGMVPAMAKGEIEGIKMAAMGASAAATVPGPLKLPAVGAAATAGKIAGSVNYWYKQGAGSLYADLKDQEVEDLIAIPTAHIAGAMYGAVEFSQVDKLIPGTKEFIKKGVATGVKKAVSKLVLKYGATWAQEVTEEGVQEVVMEVAKDVAMNIAKKADKSAGDIVSNALIQGLSAIKNSAVPMMLLLAPKATVDVTQTVRHEKAKAQAKKFLQTPAEGVGIRFSRQEQPSRLGFFSAVEQTLSQKLQGAATAEQIKGILKNTQGIKQEELDQLGIMEYLDTKPKFTKDEVMEFVRQGGVQLEEVVKGEGDFILTPHEDQPEILQIYRADDPTGEYAGMVGEIIIKGQGKDNPLYEVNIPGVTKYRFDTLAQAKDYVKEKTDFTAKTKFQQYQLPGGENYREILLTLPPKSDMPPGYTIKKIDDGAWKIIDPNGTPMGVWPTRESAVNSQLRQKGNPNFKSGHFDILNILVHFRVNDRQTKLGKTLFIEEIQNDRKIKMEEQEGLAAVAKEQGDTEAEAKHLAEAERLRKMMPFADKYYELAFKRILRYAAENGYDAIGLTPGSVQSDRYDMSKHIEKIGWEQGKLGRTVSIIPKGGIETLDAVVSKNGTIIQSRSEWMGKPLSAVIGKEMAEKVLSAESGELSGLDLKVGGEGKRRLYDEIFVQFLNKYTKKWGGRVQEAKIDAGKTEGGYDRMYADSQGELSSVHALAITPAMKESVMQGQPMFSRQGKGGDLSAEEIRDRVVRLTDGMSNRPDFIVVQSHKDAEQYAGGEVPTDVEGFFVRLNDQDTIVFIADGLRQDRLDFVLYHELVGHYGMKAIMGPKMAMTLQMIYDNSPEIRSAADEIMTSFPEYSFVRAVEEALADKAGEVVKGRTEPSWWAKPRKIIRDAVRAFVKQDLTMDAMDIAVIIADSKRLVEGQEFMVEGEAVPIGADQEEAIGADIEEEMQQEINDLLTEDIVDQEIQEEPQLGKISETDSTLMRDIMRIEEIDNAITQHEQRLETMKQLPKIRPYNKGDLKEELADIPKYFMSEEGMPLDYVVMNTDDLTYFPKGTTESDVIEFYRKSYVSPEERREIAKMRKEQKRLIAETKLKNPVIKAAVESIQKKNIGPIRVSEAAIIKRLYQERFKGERAGFRAGKEEAAQTIKTAKDILDRRRSRIRGIQEQWNLSDADLKKINKRDIRLMSNYEFKLFIDKIEAMAAAYADRREIKNQILFQIQSKELQKTENLMALLKIQSLDKASVEQLNELIQILEDAQKGDVFLSVRKLETVDNTELEGIKTYREARERLAKKIGVPLEKVSNLEVSQLDKFLYDTALARQNPFYKMLVDEANGSLLDGEQRYMDMEREVDELTIKARQSRTRSMFDQFAPTDPLVFEWLESPKERKEELALEMTPEELALASYLQARFAQAREYLIEHQVLKHFQSDYITHIRRGFLETWKEDGILKAFKEIFKQHQEDEAIFKILEGDTQNILPLEKFFQFSMRRSGELTPSKNVSKAFKSYMKAFTKKQSLDKIVPALDIYAHALSPAGVTQRGLQMNRQLIQFTKEWINNKKGRKSSLGGVIPQGGKIDLGLRAVDAFITLIDLGLNIPVGLTVQIGEQITTYVNLGTAQYLKGVQRMNTGKGKAIIKKYQAFVGKSPWEELRNTADGLGEKFHKGIFSLFSIASIRANKIHLLGSMTEAEYESGTISSERQAELKRDIGRFRAVPGAKSILGSTSAGGALTKYKSWALPILSTVVDDLGKLSVMAGNKDFAGAMKSREFRELFRATLMTTVIALTAKGLVDDDDDTFIGILIRKAYRESLSLIGALDPTLLSSVRLLSFLNDLSVAVKQIVTAEKYKSQPGYKGPEKLRRTLLPKFLPKPKKKSKGRLRSGLRSGLR